MLRKIIIFYIVVVCVCGITPTFAYAAMYTVTPLVIDHSLKSRDMVSDTITISNNTDHQIRVYPTVNEISLNEGGDIQAFVPSSMSDRTDSITSWLAITRARTVLLPGESKDIPLHIQMNPNTQPGKYHAFVSFPTGSNRPDAEKKVAQGTVPGTIVAISVDEQQNQFLRLQRFFVRRFITGSSSDAVTYTLYNPGEDPVTPAGEIIFYSNSGSEVGSIPVNPEKIAIAPSKNQIYTAAVPDVLRFGKYKAFLSVEYGKHLTDNINDTAFFYIIPLKQLLLLFVLVMLGAVSVALYVHRRYDLADEHDGTEDVSMFLRSDRSESKDHDIDLSNKTEK